jgi:ribonuclease R
MYKRKLEGKISITNSGVGYLSTEELEEDVKIESKFLNTALDGDQVKVLLFPENKQKNKQLEGEVTEIIERKKTKFVGVIDRKGKNYSFLLPDDRKMYTDIFIPHVDKKLKDGYKALVEMTSWESSKKSPVGKIIKVLGKKGSEEVEREAIVLEKGMEVDFPKEVKKEAKKIKKGSSQIKKEEIKKRRDFRDRKTFTIDPESAKDFDDALSFKKIEDDLFEIGIHIADVSTYVEKGNKIDQEARKRGFSIYMVGETVPMLPEILSNDLCSLNPNEEKLAFSAVFKMNSKGEVNDLWVGETIIESDKRYSYKQAMKKIEKGDSDLKTLNKIAKTLRKKRVNEGSLKFNTDEVIFNLDSSGKPIEIIKKEVLDTHKLIEEFMLLANRKVANKFDSDPFIFRVHEEPDEKTIQELKGFLSGLGYDVSLGDKITSEKINDIINQVEGKPVEFLVSNIILRSMTKAYYSTKNKGHFGLGFEKYTHFTSPIRRYADLETHRIIKRKLKNKSLESKTAYEAICLETSENELRALDAERESIAYKKCEYMLPQVGKTRKAIISGITQWGIYVRDLESFAEGMISLRSLQDDYYVLDKEKYRLIGRNTNKTFSLGDEVKVVVEKVDLEDKLIDFKLV